MTDHAGAGIVPVSKALVVDLVTELTGDPHDKPEGIALLGDDRVAISNDDDFGVVGTSPPACCSAHCCLTA